MNFRTDQGTASSTRLPEKTTRSTLRFVPAQRVQDGRQFGTSERAGKWQPPPNPTAGAGETAWFEKNLTTLGAMAGLWIAIKGKRVRASSDDLEEILDWLVREHIVDALIVQVPADVTQDQYIIA